MTIFLHSTGVEAEEGKHGFCTWEQKKAEEFQIFN